MRKRHFLFIVIALFTAAILTQVAAAESYDSVYSSATFSTLVEYDKSSMGVKSGALFAVFNEGIGEASCLDLAEYVPVKIKYFCEK
jgi:hypothetical protein